MRVASRTIGRGPTVRRARGTMALNLSQLDGTNGFRLDGIDDV